MLLGPTSLALAASFAAISLAGILNALPYQEKVYQAYSRETGIVGFLRNQDPVFAAYRYLASAPGVTAVWQVDRAYFNIPGYYYLHRKIPLYTGRRMLGLFSDAEKSQLEVIASSVSHIVSADPATSVPGYSVEKHSAPSASCAETRTSRLSAHGRSTFRRSRVALSRS